MTTTVSGYNASWATHVQEVLDDATITTSPRIVKDDAGRVYLLDSAGTVYVINVPGGTGPVPVLYTAFTFDEVGELGSAIWYSSKLWFTLRFTAVYKVYSWDGTTVTLEYTSSDGRNLGTDGKAVLWSNDTDLYVGYPCSSVIPNSIIVRRNNSGAWTDLVLSITGFGETNATPVAGTGYSTTWFMLWAWSGDVGSRWETFSPTGYEVGQGKTQPALASPCFFNGFVYILGTMDVSGSDKMILSKLNYSSGVVVTTDLTTFIGGDSTLSMVVLSGSLYISSLGLGKLFKSNGTDTLTWAEVT